MRQSKEIKVEDKTLLIKQLGASDKWLLESVFQELMDKAISYAGRTYKSTESGSISKAVYVVSRYLRDDIKDIIIRSVNS